jgi:tetratricopeptide (TPR) repeat protein
MQNGNGVGRSGRLKSWKEIAAYFGADERTVKRWEAKRGLPVHRLPGGAKSTVYAEPAELDHWLMGKATPERPPPNRRRAWIVAAAALLLALAGGGGLMLGALMPEPALAHHQPTQEVADFYFAGRYNFERRTPESLNRAVQLFGEAIRRDPDYAEAHAGLANCHLLLREYAGVPDDVAYRRARAEAAKALALDDGLADAHAALAFVSFFYDRNFASGLAGFRRAIALDPSSAGARHWYATALFHAGLVQPALDQINAAQRIDPQSHAILADKALILFSAGDGVGSITLLRQMEAADPDYLSPHAYLAGIHLARGEYPAYLAEERIAARLTGSGDRLSIVAAAERGYAAGGGTAMFDAMLARQSALYAAGREHAFTLAATYAIAGRREAAMRALAVAVRDRDPYLVGLRIDSRLAGLRGNPEFQRLALSVGGG